MLIQSDIDSIIVLTINMKKIRKSDYYVSKKSFDQFLNCKIKRRPQPDKKGNTHTIYATLSDDEKEKGMTYPRQIGWGKEYFYDANRNKLVPIENKPQQ